MVTVNTRLVLRNDELSNWNASNKELLKGEAALAWLSGDLYEIRVGTGGKTWSQLGGCNIRIPAANVRDLAYAEYQLSALDAQAGEASRFQLCGRNPATLEWTAIGDPIAIPEVDVSEIEGKIGELSGKLSAIPADKDVPTLIDEAVASLSGDPETATSADMTIAGARKYAEEQAGSAAAAAQEAAEQHADEVAQAVSAETLVSAEAYAISAADEAYAKAEGLADDLSTAIEEKYDGEIQRLEDKIAGGVKYVGAVDEISVKAEGDLSSGWYRRAAEWLSAGNGDLVLSGSAEYLWSDSTKTWDKLGDEGESVSKAYVDEAAAHAEAAAISATENAVAVSADVDLSACAAGANTGDILVIKKTIADGKFEHTAYVWNADGGYSGDNAWRNWTAMDGNYSAENVIMPSNMTITYPFGKYTIPSGAGKKELSCAGMSVKDFINDAFAETKPGAITEQPSITLAVGSYAGSKEVGDVYSLPKATMTFNKVGKYEFGPATGITIPATSAVVKRQTAGVSTLTADISSDVAFGLGDTLELPAATAVEHYLDTSKTYTWRADAYTLSGAIPKNNMGGDSPATAAIPEKHLTAQATATYSGYRKTFYYVGSDDTAADSAFLRTSGNGHSSDNSVNKGKTLTIPAGTKRVVYAIKGSGQTLKYVTDVDGMGLDVKGNFSATNVTVEGASEGYSTTYTVFDLWNGAGLKATSYEFSIN